LTRSPSTTETARDYADSGLTIQAAFVDHYQRFPERDSRPPYIIWGGRKIFTADTLAVPRRGIVRGEILTEQREIRQGFDLKVEGWLQLADGSRVTLLRTWDDPQYEPMVEYPFEAKDGLLKTWNVYEMRYPQGRTVTERWTENAGFWIEEVGPADRIYHCSHGMASPPDFESFVYRITVLPPQPPLGS
jgi:hypothetical protein